MSAAVSLKRLRVVAAGRCGSTAPAKQTEDTMSSGLLQGKIAIVFGAGGSIGSAAAKEFAVEGAQLFLAGRTWAHVEGVMRQIAARGGRAEAAMVNALDDGAVNEYLDRVVSKTGRIDAVFNATGPLAREYGNGKYAVDLKIEEFTLPLTTVVKSQFITARAAARHMIKQRSGVIIFLTGSPARGHAQGTTAIGAAFGAIESLTENPSDRAGPVRCKGCLPSYDGKHGQPYHPRNSGGLGWRNERHQGSDDRTNGRHELPQSPCQRF